MTSLVSLSNMEVAAGRRLEREKESSQSVCWHFVVGFDSAARNFFRFVSDDKKERKVKGFSVERSKSGPPLCGLNRRDFRVGFSRFPLFSGVFWLAAQKIVRRSCAYNSRLRIKTTHWHYWAGINRATGAMWKFLQDYMTWWGCIKWKKH